MCSLHTAKEYDYSGGLVDIHMTEKNFNAMKFRKYLLLILCFCTSLSVSALNYQSIKDILEKLNRYSETISWINIVGHILWIPFEMLLIGPLNIIICETGVNNCIKYSTLAIKSWYKRMKTDEIKSQGNFHFNVEYYFGYFNENIFFQISKDVSILVKNWWNLPNILVSQWLYHYLFKLSYV